MWQVKGFETRQDAKRWQHRNGGAILTNKDKDYEWAAQAVNLDKEKYPYMVLVRV